MGRKRNPLRTTGFSLFFVLPIGIFGYPVFLTNSLLRNLENLSFTKLRLRTPLAEPGRAASESGCLAMVSWFFWPSERWFLWLQKLLQEIDGLVTTKLPALRKTIFRLLVVLKRPDFGVFTPVGPLLLEKGFTHPPKVEHLASNCTAKMLRV